MTVTPYDIEDVHFVATDCDFGTEAGKDDNLQDFIADPWDEVVGYTFGDDATFSCTGTVCK